ncbi:hypothetical protein M514_03928 [Trichuris suis]|uniref:Uncharacterized protein n=1 Tax=Trichuris suis TaxID=68888 RepID=A0A085N8X1_9BILA|nr:hypothetical protein M513_03928 [Trichuris suis]KFD65917.1 hypothetical protein M514_03928 [Trichuris suis]
MENRRKQSKCYAIERLQNTQVQREQSFLQKLNVIFPVKKQLENKDADYAKSDRGSREKTGQMKKNVAD